MVGSSTSPDCKGGRYCRWVVHRLPSDREGVIRGRGLFYKKNRVWVTSRGYKEKSISTLTPMVYVDNLIRITVDIS